MYYESNDFRSYLAHHGIKGMKWGVRRFQAYGSGGYQPKVPMKVRRMAKKDAKEYARAKMFYGEGAGNRRKLIKATVEERSKDPVYKVEFEKELNKQDMAKHASAAKKERKTRDVVTTTSTTARGLINIATGNAARASAAAAGIYGAYQIAKMTGTDKKVVNWCTDAFRTLKSLTSHTERQTVEEFLRARGL